MSGSVVATYHLPKRPESAKEAAKVLAWQKAGNIANGIDKTLTEFGLDVIIGPMDGRIPTIAAAAGVPVGTVPLGYSKTTSRPYGLAVVATAGQEQNTFQFMSAWDATMPKRMPPPQLVDWKDQGPLEKI
ncbi:hypothetical protein B0J14DRAFT_662361 [Halenospora varia]|nr:hypothetical protein B0J14DRAFT_662361 [Halenospora varia]